MGQGMTKNELAELVAAKRGMRVRDAWAAVRAIFDAVEKGLREDGRVTIHGLGTFERRAGRVRFRESPKLRARWPSPSEE